MGASSVPRHKFITWLAIQRRLATVDRLEKWGIKVDKKCVLCTSGRDETLDHLLFDCAYSCHIWHSLLRWMCINRQLTKWEDEVNWLAQQMKHNRARAEILKFLFAAAIYNVWIARNCRRFQRVSQKSSQRVKEIALQLHIKGNYQRKWQLMLQKLNSFPI
ncbi:uncharacterized protein LOC132612113 [Lycium barbarum]|uniref:uncharacterized protein LOC132612113 n=1 Tax=Lycium barbarum TaxID=112863 RepID=UPI00293ECFA5|nr:uncharacterized protein LOC132612113 [Lycium barbarum]